MKKIIAYIAGLPLWLLSLLPLNLIYGITFLVYIALYYLVGYRKRVVRMNMYAAFPDAPSTQIYTWQKQFYRYLARLAAEIIKSISSKKDFFEKRVTAPVEWIEKIDTYRLEGKHIVLLTGHYGNWEWAAARLSAITGYKKFVVYRQQSLGITDTWMQWIRAKGGSILLPENKIRTAIKQAKKEPVMIIMAADQSPANVNTCHWEKFMGMQTPFHPGPEKLAAILDAVVLYACVLPIEKGRYRIEFSELTQHASSLEKGQITREYAVALENDIRKNPPYWLWSHRRWKRAGIPGLN